MKLLCLVRQTKAVRVLLISLTCHEEPITVWLHPQDLEMPCQNFQGDIEAEFSQTMSILTDPGLLQG
jgi:hypothetical protein